MSKVSIIVLNWNRKTFLRECLESLRQQTYDNFETIVVDNGSSDGSVAYVKENFPEVKVVELEENHGFCKGNNIGIRIAGGEYIALLNNDTKVDKKWLEELVKGIESSPEIGFCASKMVFYDEPSKIDSAGDGFAICGASFKRGHKQEERLFNKHEYVFGACGGAALYKKDMLNDIGVLDEDFFAIFEDSDLAFRGQLKGYRCLYVPTALVCHKVNSTMGKLSEFYVYYGQRNLEYVLLKNMPLKLFIRYMPHHIFYNILAFMYFASKRKGITFLRAKFRVLFELPQIIKKRKKILNRKIIDDVYLDSIFDKHWFLSRVRAKL